MRRLFIICLLALSATALVVSVPAAPAAKKKAATPSITRVMPMRISVGARRKELQGRAEGQHRRLPRAQRPLGLREATPRIA
jgi:hypothetical protein